MSETATKKATLIGGVLADNARNQISLFKVPLCCEAAAGLGCGVKAKPILHALTRQPAVAQAWLNRGGTIVAVLWRESVVPDLRGEQVRSILAEHGLAARELAGAARESALKEFSSGAVWYRGDAVDRLSAEEAAIIAARLVRRVTAKVPLSNGTVKILLAAFSEVCRHQLTDRPLTSARLRRKLIANEILQAGRRRRRTNCRTARSLRSSISLRREGARSVRRKRRTAVVRLELAHGGQGVLRRSL